MSKQNMHKTSVGGQALIEGIMMQGPRGMAVSVRTPEGEIDTQYIKVKRLKDRFPFFGWPIIRGVVNFFESMATGYKCLMHSAEIATSGEEAEEEPTSRFGKWVQDKLGDKLISIITFIGTLLGFALAFALFFYLPIVVFSWLNRLADGGLTVWQGSIEGCMKILIFVLYILFVSRMKEINRTFQYHAAEHKTIFCYENGLDLTVENVRKQSRFHPRCGTSFIFVMLIFSVVFYTLLSKVFPVIAANRMLWMVLRLAFLPVIIGLGYEFIKYAGRHDNLLVRILSAPGLWMQRLTTKEPTEDAIMEVGIASLKAVITGNPEDDSIT